MTITNLYVNSHLKPWWRMIRQAFVKQWFPCQYKGFKFFNTWRIQDQISIKCIFLSIQQGCEDSLANAHTLHFLHTRMVCQDGVLMLLMPWQTFKGNCMHIKSWTLLKELKLYIYTMWYFFFVSQSIFQDY